MSLDPGDMDTPMHAQAVPGADRTELKRPKAVAREFADAVVKLLAFMNSRSEPTLQEIV
jgi:hypothetical protein